VHVPLDTAVAMSGVNAGTLRAGICCALAAMA
jgi:hypothetical protein